MNYIKAIFVIVALISTSAVAQDSASVDWKIAPYLWTVGINGDIAIGEID